MKTVKLGEIAELTVGFVGSMTEQYVDEGVPFLRSLNIKPFEINSDDIRYITEEFNKKIKKSMLHSGDVVIVRTGVPGTCCVVPEEYDGCNCSDVVIVRPNKELVDPLYLAGFVNFWGQKQISNNKVGAIQQHFNVRIAEEMLIMLPNLDEQRKIGKILGNLNRKISANKVINDNLSNMISDIYQHMFCAKELPSNWTMGKVSDVILQVNTGLNPRDNFVLGGGKIKYITVKNLTTDGQIDFSNCDTIDEEARQIVHNRSDISVGDILFASISPLGRCYLIQTAPNEWDINESVFSIRPNYCVVSSEYLYSYFMSDYFVSKAQSSSTGSIFKGIRIGTLLDMDIVMPTQDAIAEFTEKTKPLFLEKEKVFNESIKLKKLRDWLLPMLMNGQATISD